MITVCGERLVPDVTGALHVPAHDTLIVSDLHLEKGSSYARRGIALPPYDTRATLKRLARVIRKYQPARIVSLGDSFHDPDAPHRLAAADRDALTAMTRAHTWVWIAGNHEGLVDGGALGGMATEEMNIGRLLLRHEPAAAPATGEISGHLHPCGVVRQRGRRLRRRCFVSDGTRLVMPAFGAYTGNLNVLDQAFAPLFDMGFSAWLMGDTQVYPMPSSRLVRDEVSPSSARQFPARLTPVRR
ncbi:ligase-associated DNA damage response endonuclease PdeM [Pyruvatibacter sp.]|uniref:ligase-associated DNA damage response endonuclease PdeM n=1 Tax=Pyruvatibacter sp. TaxID=1981328 RepID=UPI0032F002E3